MKHIVASRKNYEYQIYDSEKDKTLIVFPGGTKKFYEKISKELENPEIADINYINITLDEYNEFAELDKKDVPMEKALANADICSAICNKINITVKEVENIIFAYTANYEIFVSEITFK